MTPTFILLILSLLSLLAVVLGFSHPKFSETRIVAVGLAFYIASLLFG